MVKVNPGSFGWLCWGLTSQSTIFQSYRDGAIASWVINQYFRGVKCLAQGHNTAAVGLEPRTSRSGVRHSTTEPPRSPGSFEKSPRVWAYNLLVQVLAAFWSFYYSHHFVPVPEDPFCLIILYDILFYFIHVYIAPGQEETTLGDKFLMEAERSYHCHHWLHVSKNISGLCFYAQFFMILYIHI